MHLPGTSRPGISMRQWGMLVGAAMLIVACDENPQRALMLEEGSHLAMLDQSLVRALKNAAPWSSLNVIVNLEDSPAGSAVAQRSLRLGAGVIRFKHLSMLAVQATPSEISAIRGMNGVQSVYLNRELQYFSLRHRLAESVASIKADQVQIRGITGKGVGIAILDTGINGFQADVSFPEKTGQNARFVAPSRDRYAFGASEPLAGAELF